jgi:low temperature requirement protein LtrA
MRKYLPVVATHETHSVTTLELFFDLVFVFALTQITAFTAADPTAVGFARGFVMLALLWWGWVCYSWLGNQAKADEGALRAGLVVAMAAMFIGALAIPNSFRMPSDGYHEPWLFAVSYSIVRFTHLGIYWWAAGNDKELKRQLYKAGVSVSTAAILLLAGAFVAPQWQLWLWLASLAVDYIGIWVAGVDGWRVPAPKHFAERYGLIVIVALGESIVATGVGIGSYELTGDVVIAALLALVITVCLWWLYFDVVAIVAEGVLAKKTGAARARLARDSYSYLHFPMILGIVILALGLKKTMGYIADDAYGPFYPLSATAAITLCLGPAVYLFAHLAFRYRNIRSINKARMCISLILLMLMPVSMTIPAIFAIGAVTLLLVGLVVFEVKRYAEARDRIRHAPAHGHESLNTHATPTQVQQEVIASEL